MGSLSRAFGRTGLATVALVALAASGAAPASAQTLGPLTFTAAQADAGATTFASVCAGCHGANLQGGVGPRLDGGAVFERYSAGTVRALFSYISQNMPANDPGTLTAEQYLNIVAFIAETNGFTAGTVPLPADTAALGAMGFTQ